MKSALAASFIGVAACSSGTTAIVDLDDGRVVVAELGPTERRDLDVLFVYDDSAGSVFINGWPTGGPLWTLPERWDGRAPNLHVGIISQDMGAGSYEITACDDSQDGRLQNQPRGACAGPSDPYIIDVDDGQGGRVRNYTGTLDETFGCIDRLGIDGCGFEQPLAALRRAIDGSQPHNAGFLRDDAALVIVIVMDEDDCSVVNPALFDPDDSSLGPLSSFRCFEYGVTCHEGDPDPRQPGPRASCEPREDSPYMMAVADVFDAVVAAKGSRADIGVVAAIGDTDAIEVQLTDTGNPELTPCEGATGQATADIRLESFVDRFGTRGQLHTACTDTDYSALAESVGSMAQRTLGVPCLTAPGTDCVAELVDYSAAEPSRRAVPTCDPTASNQPCFAVEPDATCATYPDSLALEYRAPAPLAPDQRLELRCRP